MSTTDNTAAGRNIFETFLKLVGGNFKNVPCFKCVLLVILHDISKVWVITVILIITSIILEEYFFSQTLLSKNSKSFDLFNSFSSIFCVDLSSYHVIDI